MIGPWAERPRERGQIESTSHRNDGDNNNVRNEEDENYDDESYGDLNLR